MHGDKQLLNSTYPAKFRKNIEGRVRARNINLILGDYIDTFPEPGFVGLTTRKGEKISDADLVVCLWSLLYQKVALNLTSVYRVWFAP